MTNTIAAKGLTQSQVTRNQSVDLRSIGLDRKDLVTALQGIAFDAEQGLIG